MYEVFELHIELLMASIKVGFQAFHQIFNKLWYLYCIKHFQGDLQFPLRIANFNFAFDTPERMLDELF